MIPLIARTVERRPSVALIDAAGAHLYGDLLDASRRGAARLLGGRDDLAEARVAYLCPPSFDWVACQWSIWRAGGVAVPLATVHPEPELEATVADCDAELLVAHPDLAGRLRPIAERRGLPLLSSVELLAEEAGEAVRLPEVEASRRAMIVYTSGTTSRPKGAVTTHANIAAQVESLVEAWQWSPDDRILLVLPLHHVHGIVNVVCCALWSGASCEMLPRFDAEEVWRRLAARPISLFMAVPTIYARLIRYWEEAPVDRQARLTAAASRLRLMVSGSAALPVSVLERWRELSGHVLLERYGMTEIGMALSNPLDGRRVAGSVGTPLPGVEVRRVDADGEPLSEDGEPGELEVRGPGVFLEYWRRPEATRDAFRAGGWFRTGDVAVIEDGRYRLLGRQSVDIIKTGGFKVSALEIEEVLRTHPAIAECAVVGVADDEWGERVAAAIEVAAGAKPPTLDELRAWARELVAAYKVPSRLRVVAELPRNPLGKVTKPAVAELFATA